MSVFWTTRGGTGWTEKDLRPISLTCAIAKVMEYFTRSRLLPQLDSKIDPRQYSRNGHSKTDGFFLYIYFKRPTKRMIVARRLSGFSLPISLRVWFDWSLDIDAATCQSRSSSCVPSLDCRVLGKPEAGSLNRSNFARLVNTKKSCAQGTKLGAILFTVMT